jgi:hypothetical protein
VPGVKKRSGLEMRSIDQVSCMPERINGMMRSLGMKTVVSIIGAVLRSCSLNVEFQL